MKQHRRYLLLLNGGYDRIFNAAAISTSAADAVTFGTLIIANPDLVNRFRHRLPLAAPDADTFYTPGTQAAPTIPLTPLPRNPACLAASLGYRTQSHNTNSQAGENS